VVYTAVCRVISYDDEPRGGDVCGGQEV